VRTKRFAQKSPLFWVRSCKSYRIQNKGFFMLKLHYPFTYKCSGNFSVRVYQVPCPQCGKLRWKRTTQLRQICKSCHTTNVNQKRVRIKYPCSYKVCSREITRRNHYCRIHKRLVLDRYKSQARWAVHNAIVGGRLQRLPCERCTDTKSEAHHPDHHNPLDVKWYCKAHHLEAHGGRFI
jgi:hypothetical protein